MPRMEYKEKNCIMHRTMAERILPKNRIKHSIFIMSISSLFSLLWQSDDFTSLSRTCYDDAESVWWRWTNTEHHTESTNKQNKISKNIRIGYECVFSQGVERYRRSEMEDSTHDSNRFEPMFFGQKLKNRRQAGVLFMYNSQLYLMNILKELLKSK